MDAFSDISRMRRAGIEIIFVSDLQFLKELVNPQAG